MSYTKKIEIFEIIQNINTPLASNPSIIASCCIGDHVVIFDDEVWIKDWNDERVEQYAKAIYKPDFVRMNTTIFQQIG